MPAVKLKDVVLVSPGGWRSGEATAQGVCQQETLYADRRKAAAPCSTAGVPLFLLSARRENRLQPPRGTYPRLQKQPPAPAGPRGRRACVFLARNGPLERTFLSEDNVPIVSPAAGSAPPEEDRTLSLSGRDFSVPGSAFVF